MNYEPYIQQARAEKKRLVQLAIDGRPVWVKFSGKNHHNQFQYLWDRLIGFFMFGEKSHSEREQESIEALRRRGMLVPEILASGIDYLVLSDVGPSLQGLMREATLEERKAWIEKIVQTMKKLHAAQGWHGCMAIKNLTYCAPVIGMVDFESHLIGRWPLKVRQAADMFRLCESLLKFEQRGALILHAIRYYRRTSPLH